MDEVIDETKIKTDKTETFVYFASFGSLCSLNVCLLLGMTTIHNTPGRRWMDGVLLACLLASRIRLISTRLSLFHPKYMLTVSEREYRVINVLVGMEERFSIYRTLDDEKISS